MKYGFHKYLLQKTIIRRWAYRLFGEIHIPARIRAGHVLKQLKTERILDQQNLEYLDAGSGQGDMSFFLAHKKPGWKINGLDYEQTKVDGCNDLIDQYDLNNLIFSQGDLTQINYSQQFDLITNMDVLEHINNDQLVLKKFFRALKPGGKLFLTFPSYPQYPHLGLVSRRDKKHGITLEDSGHVRPGYNPEQIKTLLEQEGFQNIKVKYTFGWPGTRAFDIFFIIGDSAPNPFVFLACLPLLLFLGWFDVLLPNHKLGSALLVSAQKTESSKE